MKSARVLFVCMGNICRSPTAHGVFSRLVERAGLQDSIQIDSAGTGAWHVGHAPDRRSQQVAASRGYDLSGLSARQVCPADFDRFDYLLAMDSDNLAALEVIKPAAFDGELGLFLDFAEDARLTEVPDPYYGGERGFEEVLEMIEQASRGLLQHIQRSV